MQLYSPKATFLETLIVEMRKAHFFKYLLLNQIIIIINNI